MIKGAITYFTYRINTMGVESDKLCDKTLSTIFQCYDQINFLKIGSSKNEHCFGEWGTIIGDWGPFIDFFLKIVPPEFFPIPKY